MTELDHDPTDSIERKVQRLMRKIKTKLPSNIYSKIYPAESSPGKLYGTTTVHKSFMNCFMNWCKRKSEWLTITPIISNIGTSIYYLAKYFAQLLNHLSESQYMIKNIKDFTRKLRKQKLPKSYMTIIWCSFTLHECSIRRNNT